MLGSSNSLGISNRTLSKSQAKFFDLGGEIGIDTFVIRNFSIGFDLAARYGDDQGYGATTLTETTSRSLSGGARFGVNVPLSNVFSWYPRVTLGLMSAHSDTRGVPTGNNGPLPPPTSQSSIGPWLNLYAPFLLHPAPHFLVGFGPRVEHDFAVTRGGPYDGAQSTLVSGEFVIGGWWGGPKPDASDSDGSDGELPAKKVEHAFGEEGQVVLTVATGASLSFQTYSGSKGSNTNVNLHPSFDYFVAPNVSLGVAAFVDYGTGTSLDSSETTTNVSSTSVGFAPDIGVNIPLTGQLSFWPQAALGYGTVDTNQTSFAGANQHSRKRSWVAIFTPLLVHPTSHFFLGMGPDWSHELSDTDQYGYENDATSVGASFVLGGWL